MAIHLLERVKPKDITGVVVVSRIYTKVTILMDRREFYLTLAQEGWIPSASFNLKVVTALSSNGVTLASYAYGVATFYSR